MLAVKARLTVEADGTGRLRLPGSVPPGEHEVVVVVEERAKAERPQGSILDAIPTYDLGPWPEGFEVRREEIYGDDGR
jgi:hypothetical protein